MEPFLMADLFARKVPKRKKALLQPCSSTRDLGRGNRAKAATPAPAAECEQVGLERFMYEPILMLGWTPESWAGRAQIVKVNWGLGLQEKTKHS